MGYNTVGGWFSGHVPVCVAAIISEDFPDMKIRKPFVLVFLLIPLLGYSRTPDWQLLTRTHTIYEHVVFKQLSSDTVGINAYGKSFAIPVDSIQTIRDANGPYGQAILGFLVGAIGGGLIGNRIGKNQPYQPGFEHMFDGLLDPILDTAAGIILGSLLGTGIGAYIKVEVAHDFTKMDHAKKLEVINRLIEQYKLDANLRR